MKKRIPVLLLLMFMFCIATVKLFGTTVSSKFSNAQTAAHSQIDFGGGSSDSFHAPRPTYQNRAVPLARPTPPIARTVRQPAAEPTPPAAAEAPKPAAQLSTFSIDVDTGSYTLARGEIRRGVTPYPEQVRLEEFVNYFDYDYAAPSAGKTATVRFEAAPTPLADDPSKYLISIGFQAAHLAKRPPIHLTFLVDVSGSMRDRMPAVHESIRTAVRTLDRRDSIAIVTYAGESRVVLASTRVANQKHIGRAVASLRAGGGTAMSAGMDLAYDIAVKHAGAGRVSRVMVLSDGDANIGRTTSGGILDVVRSRVDDGVTLSTVGYGNGNYNDALMEQLADAGDGNYTYIDDATEATRVFSEKLNSLLFVVAKDVKVQIEFDPDAVRSWRQLGYTNRALTQRQFRDDRVDAGEIGSGHQVTALYEVELQDGVNPASPLATARVRYKDPDGGKAKEVFTTFEMSAVQGDWTKASDDFRFQAAVAGFAEVLRNEASHDLGHLAAIADGGRGLRPQRSDFVGLVRETQKLRGRL